jgi:CDP-diglyceride synthetase
MNVNYAAIAAIVYIVITNEPSNSLSAGHAVIAIAISVVVYQISKLVDTWFKYKA